MTENRVPTTEAGRAHLDYIRRWSEDEGAKWTDRDTEDIAGRIIAIEDEAREQPAPPVDVERLGTAMHNTGVTLCDNGGPGSSLDDVAAEYARLGSAPSTEVARDD